MGYSEQLPIEAGFSDVFAAKIAPQMDDLEAKRAKMSRTGWILFFLPVAGSIPLAYLMLEIAETEVGGYIAGALMLAGGVGLGWFLRSMRDVKLDKEVAAAIMPVVCDFLGRTQYDKSARAGFATSLLRDAGMVPRFDKARYEDLIDGHHRDVRYSIVEALLSKEVSQYINGETRVQLETVFSGVLIRIVRPRAEDGSVLPIEDRSSVYDAAAGVSHVVITDQYVLMAQDRTDNFLQLASFDDGIDGLETALHKLFSDLQRLHNTIDAILGPEAEPMPRD
ncbi:hypothetical protein [Cognatishimia sp. F0-27]|uniref:hypothetical protein n=1 Tax=Cognatishimia sp. F0-27 TaxID=2816855 RepID=UPI001D0C684E|nr:hypothetical protein [Cognatishimia sp. F0-27]MCC1493041.1 hypothetical protein [Cognatishimia sp. F0-27]